MVPEYVSTSLFAITLTNVVSVSFAENYTVPNCSREEFMDKLPSEDSELKHAYQTAHSIDQRSQIFDNVIDLYGTYFRGLEMRIRGEVTKRFEYSISLGQNAELRVLKEELTKEFSKDFDKYVEVSLKHKIFRRDLKEFQRTLSKEEQMKFFQDYFHAYNFTQSFIYPEYRPQYTPVNISDI